MEHLHESGFNASADNAIDELRYNLHKASSWLKDVTRQQLKPYGITPKQYNILVNLAKSNPKSASIQEVRDSLADKMSDASRLIDRLVKKGYLNKFPSEYDRRSNRVQISASGLDILNGINDSKGDMDRLISDLLSDKEMEDLNRLLGQLK